MYIVSYSERKLTLVEMTFRAKTDVTNVTYDDVSTLRYARSFERLQLRTSGFKRFTSYRLDTICDRQTDDRAKTICIGPLNHKKR